ncbi:MAG: TonB-dependent receptor [Acidobacteria bacterium]|nr:TonB-dependent receptor [Acidobacteriota bacterium]MYJ02912.1 TonB-dependent receptor [Acidobacteriota bacterium]
MPETSHPRSLLVGAVATMLLLPALCTAAQQTNQDQTEEQAGEEPVTFAETVVVTASRVEQEIINAPATVTVIGAEAIEAQSVMSIGELVRQVPGVNVIQTSNRDFNVTSRGATGTLSPSQIVMIDGRTVYQDFYGFVAWDVLPITPDNIERVEVVRGPASAVWGANAMSGVVNLITKRPRDMLGTTLDINFGTFDRSLPGHEMEPGSTFSVMGTHAAAPTDSFAYKMSVGYTESAAFARPVGEVPNITGRTQLYPTVGALDSRTPKFDFRGDWDAPDGVSHIRVSAGYGGSQGTLHTGIGPFELRPGTRMAYSRLQYQRNNFEIGGFVNSSYSPFRTLLVQDANGLIDGEMLSNTMDLSFSNTTVIGTRNILSYGGNVRQITMRFDLGPAGDGRNEQGFYIQDEIFLHDRFRWIIGGRADRVSTLDDVRFSPRTTFIFKPANDHSIRVSYNKAFRAPSLTDSFLDVNILQPVHLPLGDLVGAVLGPAAAQLPIPLPGTIDYLLPLHAAGSHALNRPLGAENLTAYELAYAGGIGNRVGVTAAFYVNDITDSIDFTELSYYSTANPPDNWNSSLAGLRHFAATLPAVLPPGALPPHLAPFLSAVAQNPAVLVDLLAIFGGRLPAELTYVNRGFIRNKGLELGMNAAVTNRVNTYVNYSWQADPEVRDWDPNAYNIPSAHRFNAGIDARNDRLSASLTVNHTTGAFWSDVLGPDFHGWTEPFTMVNASVGLSFAEGRFNPRIQVTNLLNQEIQQHIFGDVLKRQVMGQLHMAF